MTVSDTAIRTVELEAPYSDRCSKEGTVSDTNV